MSNYSKWRNLSTSGSCLRVRVRWSARLSGESEQQGRYYVCFTAPLSCKAKLSIYRLIFVPFLPYGHEGWVMTQRTRLRVQATEMGFLRRVAGVSLWDMVRSSAIREVFRKESVEVVRASGKDAHRACVREVFQARPVWRRPRTLD